MGCKRLCVDTDYYEIYNQDHVSLIDLNETPITRIDGNAIVTGDVRHDVDAIVLATGFDAMTGAVMNIDIRGQQGQTLQDKWAAGPKPTWAWPPLASRIYSWSPAPAARRFCRICCRPLSNTWVDIDCIDYMNSHQHRSIDPNPARKTLGWPTSTKLRNLGLPGLQFVVSRSQR